MLAFFFKKADLGLPYAFWQSETIPFERHSYFITVLRWVCIWRNIVITYRSRTWVDIWSPESNKINLKSESCLCNQMYARESKVGKLASYNLFHVKSNISKKFIGKK